MNKVFQRFFVIAFLVIGLSLSDAVFADAPPPPPAEQGSGGDQPPGGGAPIGEGILLLTLFSAGYAAGKLNKTKPVS